MYSTSTSLKQTRWPQRLIINNTIHRWHLQNSVMDWSIGKLRLTIWVAITSVSKAAGKINMEFLGQEVKTGRNLRTRKVIHVYGMLNLYLDVTPRIIIVHLTSREIHLNHPVLRVNHARGSLLDTWGRSY